MILKIFSAIILCIFSFVNLYSQNTTSTAAASLADAGFSFVASGGQCMGNEITFFPYEKNPLFIYRWDFGDENISSEINPVHVYKQPGYYNVSLDITGFDDTAICYSEIIYIIPSTDIYNINCCSETQVYTTHIPGMTYDATTGDFTVQTTGTPVNINSGTAYIIKGSIIVPANAILNINTDAIVQFGPLGKIIVERGGKLNLIDCTLRGLIDCITMWQGIEVWGNSSLSQANQNDHGYIYIGKESIIRDAHTAVLLGKTKLSLPNACTIPLQKTQYDLSYSGGIVNAANSSFNNNAIGIKFIPYKFSEISNINSCTIETDGTLLDPGYNSSYALYNYDGVNIHNPFYATANPDWRTEYGIYQWDVKDITFGDNYFTNVENGMYSIDAKFDVKTSVFNTVDYGIAIYNTYPSVYNRHKIIQTNIFDNIGKAAIRIDGGRFDYINGNTFGYPTSQQINNNVGLYLNNSSNFEVSENLFNGLVYGISCHNSGLGGGLISNRVNNDFGNSFLRCKQSFYATRPNIRLQNRCNKCDNPVPVDYYRNWVVKNKLADQGKNIPGNTQAPAGNTFATLLIRKEIRSENFTFNYYHHSDADKTPVADGVLTNFNIIDLYVNFNSSLSCQRKLPSLSNTLTLKNKISALQSEYNTVLGNLDKGKTALLLNAISSGTSSAQLKNMLVNNSPLSDTVLVAYITRTYPVPPGHFKEVIIPNSPVSDTVLPYLLNKILSLPPGIKQQVINAQKNNPLYRTLTTIERELNTAVTERTLELNELTARWLDNDSADYAISFLETENNVDVNQMLSGTYLDEGDLTSARTKLDEIPSSGDEITAWKNIMDMLINFADSGNTVFEMSQAQEDIIRSIAENPVYYSQEVSNAQAILRLVYGEEFPMEMLENSSLKTENPDFVSDYFDTLNYLGNNIPNPFSNTTVIPCYVPDNANNAILEIFDITGKKIAEYPLQQGFQTVEISLSRFESGLYIYSLNAGGIYLQHKRMVLIK